MKRKKERTDEKKKKKEPREERKREKKRILRNEMKERTKEWKEGIHLISENENPGEEILWEIIVDRRNW